MIASFKLFALFLLSAQAHTNSQSLSTNSHRIVDSYADLQGTLYNKSPQEQVQIVDFRFGITKELVLCPAYLSSVGFDGEPYVLDQRSLCSKVFNSIDEVRGFYLAFGKSTYWVEDITFAIGSDGAFFPAAYTVTSTIDGNSASKTILEAFPYQHTQPCL